MPSSGRFSADMMMMMMINYIYYCNDFLRIPSRGGDLTLKRFGLSQTDGAAPGIVFLNNIF
jgi:hypothetical protein